MTLQELLNADLDAVGRWIRQGLSWWMGELAQMVPPALRRTPSRRAPWLAEMQTQAGPIRLWRDGAPVEVLHGPRGEGRSADLLLPADAVLVRDLELPRISAPDLRRLIDLNIDRFTPFRADQVYFDTVILGPAEAGSKQRVRLGILARDRGGAMLELARVLGLKVERIGVGSGEDGRTLQFDFMRAIRAETGGGQAIDGRVWLWSLCAGLVAANLIVAVLRDVNDVAQLGQLVEAQRPLAAQAMRLRRTVETERARRMALLTRRGVHEPLRILDAVTRALPSDAWVQRLEWNGRAVRLVGFKRPAFDLLAALHGPALVNARSLVSDMPTRTANNQAPFDVMADSAARVAP